MFNYPMSFMSSTGTATNLSYANFPYSGVLPTMYTNFGGDLQCTTIDPYGGYNFGVLFNPIAAQTYGISSMYANNYMTTPPDASLGAATLANQILSPLYNNMANGQIKCSTSILDCAKRNLTSKLNSENTTEEEKQEIQKVLDQLKALEERLNALKESTNTLDPESAFKQAQEIGNEINKTLIDAKNAAAEREKAAAEAKKAEEEQNAQQNQGAEPTNQGSTPTNENQESTPTNQGAQGTDATDQNSGSQATDNIGDGSIDNFPLVVRNAAKTFYDAIDGCGTDNDKMKEVLDTYTQDGRSMLGLMLCWNEDQSAKDKESFIEAFMDDASHGQKKEYCEKIANALCEQARELGVYDAEFRKYKDAVIAEANSSWINNGTVSKNIDAMVEILGKKYGSQFTKPSK
jgi:hypothetical protein